MDSLILDSGNELHCQFCNGALNIMGILGNLEYFRCENCGMEFSVNLSRKEIKLKEEGDYVEWIRDALKETK